MIFLLPYIFSAVLVVQNKKISTIFALFIGSMAGLGVGLKPYFLFPVILIELYLMMSKRSVFAWVRVESITCLIVLVVYLSSVFILHKNYIHIMLPLISHLYFISIKESWSLILLRPFVIYSLLIWGYFFVFKKNNQRELVTILMLALTGMLIAFIVPRSAWYYHVLPALGLACLLGWLYCTSVIAAQLRTRKYSKMDVGIFVLSGFMVFVIPLGCAVLHTARAIFLKHNLNTAELSEYINSLPQPQRLYCFSANTTEDCFPLVDQTHSEFTGRFPFFWWLRGVIHLEEVAGKQPLSPLILNDKKYLMNLLVEDLNQLKPTLIIINTYYTRLNFDDDFDYIAYFLKDEKFREAWKHYHYLKTINIYQLYVRS